MGLNYIYERYSVSLAMADRTDDHRVEAAHLELADRYAHLIEAARRDGTSACPS